MGSTSPGKHGGAGKEVGRVGKEAGPRWYITKLPKHHKEAQLLAPPHKVVLEKLYRTPARGQDSRQFTAWLLLVSRLLLLKVDPMGC